MTNKFKIWLTGCMITVPLVIGTVCVLSSYGVAAFLQRIVG